MPQSPHKRRRWVRLAGWLAVALPLVLAALFGWTWYRDPAATVLNVEVSPTKDVRIGTVVTCRATVEAPWYRLPLLPVGVTLPPGLQQVGDGRRRLVGVGAGTWRWAFEVAVQPYDLGKREGAKLSLTVAPDRHGNAEPLAVLVPALEVTPVLGADEQTLKVAERLSASDLAPRQARWWWWAAAAVLVCAAVVGALLWRRRGSAGPTRQVPPWEWAQTALQGVEERLPMAAEEFFVEVTDILRAYTERRFAVPATEQATPEFLATLQRSHALGTDQRLALAEFLTAADMIKFARAEATQNQLVEALARAKRFVVDTRPPPEPAAAPATPAAPPPPAPPPAVAGRGGAR